jgi:hypothetical protein
VFGAGNIVPSGEPGENEESPAQHVKAKLWEKSKQSN